MSEQTIEGVTRRVCHACVTYPRDAYCPVCDLAAQPQGEPVELPARHSHEHSGCFLSERQHGWNAYEEAVRKLGLLYSAPVAVTPSLWEICVRDEPGNPESPCEYLYASSVTERDSILRRGGASVFTEYAHLDKVTRPNADALGKARDV